MGFFSWKTNDSKKSIPSVYSSKKTIAVKMLDNKGNVWVEKNYEGYGEFGGKDYYELLAEMNGLKTREEGINLFYHNSENEVKIDILFPNLVRASNKTWTWVNEAPETCEFQGYFY